MNPVVSMDESIEQRFAQGDFRVCADFKMEQALSNSGDRVVGHDPVQDALQSDRKGVVSVYAVRIVRVGYHTQMRPDIAGEVLADGLDRPYKQRTGP